MREPISAGLDDRWEMWVNRALIAAYRPVIRRVIARPATVLLLAAVLLAAGVWPATQLGSEFMPPLDEGDLMYMPTTYPGISIDVARDLLQRTVRHYTCPMHPQVRQQRGTTMHCW